MTREEFNKTGFTANMKVAYKDGIYDLVQIDYGEGLLGIDMKISGAEESSITWVRCENAKIVA